MKNIKLFLLTLSLLSGAQSFCMLRMAQRAFRPVSAALRTPAFKAPAMVGKPLAQPATAKSVGARAFNSPAIPAARSQVKAGFARRTAVFGGFASSLLLGSAAFAQEKNDNSLQGEITGLKVQVAATPAESAVQHDEINKQIYPWDKLESKLKELLKKEPSNSEYQAKLNDVLDMLYLMRDNKIPLLPFRSPVRSGINDIVGCTLLSRDAGHHTNPLNRALKSLSQEERGALNRRHDLNMVEIELKEIKAFLKKAIGRSAVFLQKDRDGLHDNIITANENKVRLKKIENDLIALAHYRKKEFSKIDHIFDRDKTEQYDLILDALYWRDKTAPKHRANNE